MASGKAVVASRTGPGPELIEDGVDGLLFDPGDAAGLAHAGTALTPERARAILSAIEGDRLEAVVTEDGPMTVRARYDLKSSERQRLAVTLPNPRILGITVAGQTVAPEKAPAAA